MAKYDRGLLFAAPYRIRGKLAKPSKMAADDNKLQKNIANKIVMYVALAIFDVILQTS